ncbi:MAG: hypothetical protein LBV64_00870 [Mediterranea sp.]|jgi:hypothetical protein|nr:hypothetical protein [Mediterranea sp.]
MTDAERTKLSDIEEGAEVNTVTSVAGRTGDVTLTSTDVGLSNVDNTSDANKPISTAIQTALSNIVNTKVDKDGLKVLSDNNYSDTDKAKLETIEEGAQANTVISVAGETGIVMLSGADVGLGNVDNTSDLNKPISTATQTALDAKVATVAGKQLSTEDYTTGEKTKLAGLNNYTLTPATDAVLGGVRVDGTTIAITNDGIISSTGGGGEGYTLPPASNYTLGGIKVGGGLSVTDDGILSSTGGGIVQAVTAGNGLSLITGTLSMAEATSTVSGAMPYGDKVKLSTIEENAQVNTVNSVAGRTGAVTLVKGDVGLENVDNTADANKSVSSATTATTASKVANALTFIGGVTGTYDGSTAVSVAIPTIATTSIAGIVKPDNNTITITEDGTISNVGSGIIEGSELFNMLLESTWTSRTTPTTGGWQSVCSLISTLFNIIPSSSRSSPFYFPRMKNLLLLTRSSFILKVKEEVVHD